MSRTGAETVLRPHPRYAWIYLTKVLAAYVVWYLLRADKAGPSDSIPLALIAIVLISGRFRTALIVNADWLTVRDGWWSSRLAWRDVERFGLMGNNFRGEVIVAYLPDGTAKRLIVFRDYQDRRAADVITVLERERGLRSEPNEPRLPTQSRSLRTAGSATISSSDSVRR